MFTISETTRLTDSVLLLTLVPKRAADAFTYRPGQYAAIGFVIGGRPSPMRCFSIVSAPSPAGTLQFALRIGGSFTSRLAELKVGDRMAVQGPFGSFVINADFDKSVVMVAGGIGITPFISMIRDAVAAGKPFRMTLLYSCRTQQDIPFFDELLRLQSQTPFFKVYFFVTSGQVAPVPLAEIYPGKITPEVLDALTAKRFNSYSYFVCGPTGFITGVRAALAQKGTEPQRIVSEEFSQGSLAPRFQRGGRGVQSAVYGLSALATVMGVSAVMLLDLVRAVPKIASAQAESTAVSVGEVASSSTPSAEPAASSIPSSTVSTSATPASTAAPDPVATPVPTSAYQQPVSSVS